MLRSSSRKEKTVAENSVQVNSFRKTYTCDTCGTGEMEFVEITGKPTHSYKHKCNNGACEAEATYSKKYPCVEYEEI